MGLPPLPTIPEGPWSAYYDRTAPDNQPAQVFTVFTSEDHCMYASHATPNDQTLASAPILIDSGASFSVAGRTWLQAWDASLVEKLQYSSRSFKFGAGPSTPSLVAVLISLDIPLGNNPRNSPMQTVDRHRGLSRSVFVVEKITG